MSWADERAAVEMHLLGNYSSLPVQVEAIPIQDGVDISRGWVRLTILPAPEGKRITLGNNDQIFRHEGFIVLSIFTPDKQGSNPARLAADALSNLFHEKILSYNDSGFIRCGVPGLDVIGSVDGGHYQVNVTISYKRDVIRS